jgi:hypothetical protein
MPKCVLEWSSAHVELKEACSKYVRFSGTIAYWLVTINGQNPHEGGWRLRSVTSSRSPFLFTVTFVEVWLALPPYRERRFRELHCLI